MISRRNPDSYRGFTQDQLTVYNGFQSLDPYRVTQVDEADQ